MSIKVALGVAVSAERLKATWGGGGHCTHCTICTSITHCDHSPIACCSIDSDIGSATSDVLGKCEAECLEGLSQYCSPDDGGGRVLSRGHGAIGEVGGQVEEHGSCSEGNDVGVAWVGYDTIQCLPQFCTTVSSIIATVWHSASLGWSGVG